MGIMVYSLLWVMQDLYHQSYVFDCYDDHRGKFVAIKQSPQSTCNVNETVRPTVRPFGANTSSSAPARNPSPKPLSVARFIQTESPKF